MRYFDYLKLIAFSIICCIPRVANADRFYPLAPGSGPSCDIQSIGPGAVSVSIAVPSIVLQKQTIDGVTYDVPILEGYRNNLDEGMPAVMVTYFSMLTGKDPVLEITITGQETKVIDNVLMYPVQPAPAIGSNHQNGFAAFARNTGIYSTDGEYPSSISGISTTMEYRGKYLTSFWVSPMRYNPVTKRLSVYTKLKAILTMRGDPADRIPDRGAALSLLKNNALNASYLLAPESSRFIDDDDANDILIVTKDNYKPAAETLAVWQRMKGYDVKIESRASWSSAQVKTAVADFYNATTPKPGYLLIIGDHADVPAAVVSDNYTDLYYVCFGGTNDYVADMGRGRISVASAADAMNVVRKIVNYEKTPPAGETFYKTALSAALFQIKSDNVTENWAFTYCVETSIRHLKEKFGYSIVRQYRVENNGNPQYYDPSYVGYASGSQKKPVPEDIRKPNYPWTATGADVVKAIDKGLFLAFHYDHGLSNGWGDPEFTTTSVGQLKNGDMLPVFYSINCESGSFQKSCFAEALQRKVNGGSIGVIAATAVTYAGGANDALIMGLIDASFPRNIYEPKSTVTVAKRDTTYLLGDIFNHGLIRHGECCKSEHKQHSEIYHLFGDPTTDMWTAAPAPLSATHKGTIAFDATGFQVSGLNCTKGMASLVDKATGLSAGKKMIQGASVTIPVKGFTKEGEAILTITSHNFKPYQATIQVKPAADAKDHIAHQNTKQAFTIRTGSRIVSTVKLFRDATIGVTILTMNGQTVFSRSYTGAGSGVDLNDLHPVRNGVYLLDITIGGVRSARMRVVSIR